MTTSSQRTSSQRTPSQRTPSLRTPSLRTGLAALGVLCLTLTACGSDTLPSGQPSSDPSGAGSGTAASSAPTAVKDEALAARVPEKFRSKGVLIDGTDGSYAPNEFIGEDGTTMEGMDVDLLDAVATTLGLTVEYNNANFDTIILGVTSGKYDIAISSFTINPERKQQVQMVQYFNAGTSWAAAPGSGLDPDDACGKTVAVQKGTVQVDDLTARNESCVQAGKPEIVQLVEAEQSKVTADVVSGKADAMLADSPIVAYAIQQTNGQLEQVGEIYDAAPYGIVLSNDNTEMASLVSEALTTLKENGTYDAILAQWGNEAGAVSEFPVNP